MSAKRPFVVFSMIVLVGSICGSDFAWSAVIYVNSNATGSNNGTSWADAYISLQSALSAAVQNDEIWVAEGTYKPTTGTDGAISFVMKQGVAIYGGFTGTETSRDQRDWVTNQTILSGDIGAQGNIWDNTYHVVIGANNSVLDGFTITGGNAQDNYAGKEGGGMFNWESSPTVINCTFIGNRAASGGGGVGNLNNSSPTLVNCTFTGNSAEFGGGGMDTCLSSATVTNCTFTGNSAVGSDGGGMFNGGSSLTVTNCIFIGNSASTGGGMSNAASSLTVTNCTFSYNSAPGGGGGMSNDICPIVTNCILWGNTSQIHNHDTSGDLNITYSNIQGGGYSGAGNINADPCFVSGPEGDYYLSQIAAGQATNSPCVDAGSDTAVNVGLNMRTTRTDSFCDSGMVDMGYHYPLGINPDLNGDAFIDFIDYAIFADDWLLPADPCELHSGDINRDGPVDIYDLAQLIADWLTCFVTPAIYIEPAHQATDVSRNVILCWQSGEKAASHDIYFGTSFSEVNDADTSSTQFMGNQDTNFWDTNNYAPAGLDFNTTYYWRIDEAGASCTTKGDVWSFTVVSLGKATNPQPSDGRVNVTTHPVLSWSAGTYADSHDVYLGTTYDDVNLATHGSGEYMGNQDVNYWDTNNYAPAGLDFNMTYYWRIDEVAVGCTTKGDVWHFTVNSGKAMNPQPSDGWVNVTTHPVLSWSAATDANSHDVYFGTDFNEVNDADIYDPNVYMGNQDANYWDTNNYDPNGLEPDTMFYWRIDEINPGGTTKGDVWSFTTQISGLDPNFVSWWKFDEGAQTIAYDSVGDNDGTLNGDPQWVTGKIGPWAIDCDGDGDYVQIPDNDSLTPSREITVTFWLYNRGGQAAGVYKYAGCPSKSPSNTRSYLLQVMTNHVVQLVVYQSVNNCDYVESVGEVSLDQWHHIAATFDNGQAVVYIDGQPDNAEVLSVSSIMNDGHPLIIGGYREYCTPAFVNCLNGQIDDVRVYNRALSPDEVELLYQQGL